MGQLKVPGKAITEHNSNGSDSRSQINATPAQQFNDEEVYNTNLSNL
jgi:hypothetical protein